MEIKATYDLAPIMCKLIVIEGYIKTLFDLKLNDLSKDEKKKAVDILNKNMKETSLNFINQFPDIIDDPEKAKKLFEGK